MLKLNLRDPTKDVEEKRERTVKAEQKRREGEVITDEEWANVFAKKNTDSDARRLSELKAAYDAGEIYRQPSEAFTAKGKRKPFTKAEALRLYKVLEERKRKRVLQDLVDDIPDNYWLITDQDRLDEFLRIIDDEREIVFDVETTGTDWLQDSIVGHVISATKADIHAYIPTKHKTDHQQLPHRYVTERLRKYYEDESIGKIAHNAKFDIHMLENDGIVLRGLTWDTQEAMKLLNENESSYQLKKLVQKYLDIPAQTYEDLFGEVGFDEVSDLKVALAYAAKDGDVTLKLRNFQHYHLSKMPEILRYYEEVEAPLTAVIQKMERTGFDIDLDFAEVYGEKLKKEISQLYAELIEELGDINLNSPAQLKPALERVTGELLESTDAKKVLSPLANKHSIIKKLLTYKEKFKLYSTYINVLPDLIDKRSGKLYTVFNQNGAKTGRLSSGGSGVNLQNQPKEARKLFVAPKGYVILGGDFSQQEYRALAYFSQEPKLIENYLNGNDLYATVASEIFNKPVEECGDGSIYRKQTKTILLAVAYGTGPRTLAMQLGKSVKEAKEFLKSFDERFPVVAKWIESNRKFVQRHGFVWMDRKQRKRRLPHAKKRNSNLWYTSVFTRSTNAIIQGSAAIQTKTTMVELQKLCERKTAEGRGEWRLWCVVHDEALLLVPETITREDVDDFENVMLNSYVFGNVPNKTDLEIYRRWGEGMTVDEWFKKGDD